MLIFVENFFSNKEIQVYNEVVDQGEKNDGEYLNTFKGYTDEGKR